MNCFSCEKIKEKDYQARKAICGRCREVLKVDIVDLLRKTIPIYLTEINRNNNGAPLKLTLSQRSSIKYNFKSGKVSAINLAKKYGVSRSLIYSIVNDASIG